MTKTFLYTFCFLLIIAGEINAQWNYGTPFSTSSQQSSWKQVVSQIPVSNNRIMDSLTAPYPTNAWFNLFFLYGTAFPDTAGTLGQNNSFVYPYQVSLGNQYPYNYNKRSLLSVNYKPFQIAETLVSGFPKISWDNGAYMFFGTADNAANFTPVLLNNYTELSADIKFFDKTNPNKYYYSPLVRGMAYVTMFYKDVTPAIYFPSPIVHMINDVVVTPNQEFTGTSFKVQTLVSDPGAFRSQTWMIYSSQTITLKFVQNGVSGSTADGLVGITPFTGSIRAAHLTYANDPNAADVPARKTMLDAYSKFIPVKGEVKASVPAGSTTATLNYDFTRYNENSFSNDSLLMMALPHHVDMLPAGSTSQLLNYQVIKGKMSEVKKKTWVMTEQLPSYSWNPKSGTLANVPLQWCDTVKKYIDGDLMLFFGQYQASDIYSAGKVIGRLARIITITDELYDRDNSRYASMLPLAATMRDSLQIFLGRWLSGNSSIKYESNPVNRDSLVYDTRFKGLISSNSHDNLDRDYGSGRYNDHHFHYGYLLYAAAVIAKKNPAYFTNNGNYYLNSVVDLARDIANPSRSDNYFALQRYKDWYDGNSWANGLVPYGGGKNQESSSEAANAWYGIYLFGLAMNNASPNALYENMKNQGGLMLAQEIRASQKYYHINQTNPAYPVFYSNQYKTVTNLYQGIIDAHPFFLAENYTATGIQVVPVTPVTEQLWGNVSFARTIYDYSPNGLRFTKCFNPLNTNNTAWNWTTINVGIQAIAYPDTALSFWKYYGYTSSKFDNGASQSNVIHWILTRKYNTVGIGIGTVSTEIPLKYNLYQNYPNPFNPGATIKFDVSKSANVKLLVYDAAGREIAQLVNENLNAGKYQVEWNAAQYSSGVYFYKMISGDFVQTKKMMLIK